MKNEASEAAAALGRIKTAKKAEAAKENGKKGGSPSYWHLIFSGECLQGTWTAKRTTAYGLKRILIRERCGGDRWASGWDLISGSENGVNVREIEGGEMRTLDVSILIDAGIPPEVIDNLGFGVVELLEGKATEDGRTIAVAVTARRVYNPAEWIAKKNKELNFYGSRCWVIKKGAGEK